MAGRLVALDLPGGPEFVDALRRTWDAGDAVFPVDQRLPDAARRTLFEAIAPSAVIGPEGRLTNLAGGAPVEPGDALVVATSGTTGAPRGVVLTHTAVAASAVATSARLDVNSGDQWIACLPLSHVGGLSVVTRALHTGSPLTVLPGFDDAAIRSAVDVHRGDTLISLVATTLRRTDPTRFRTIVLGGARPPADLPPNVVTTYGLTETGSGVVYDGVPLDGVEVRIVSSEIHLRGPMLLRAYRDGSDPTVDGWFPTGDLGRLDNGGRLVVDGRRGDLIITGGENVWPETVESALATHPSVADVAVAGSPDPEWGQLVTAYVVPVDRSPALDELRDHARHVLPPYALPRRVVEVEAIPRTSLGKIVRARLGA